MGPIKAGISSGRTMHSADLYNTLLVSEPDLVGN